MDLTDKKNFNFDIIDHSFSLDSEIMLALSYDYIKSALNSFF